MKFSRNSSFQTKNEERKLEAYTYIHLFQQEDLTKNPGPSIIEDTKRNLPNLCSSTNSLQQSPIKRLQNLLIFISRNSVFDAREIPLGGIFFKPFLGTGGTKNRGCSSIFSLFLPFSPVQFRVITCWRARIHAESNASSRRSNWQGFPSGRGQSDEKGGGGGGGVGEEGVGLPWFRRSWPLIRKIRRINRRWDGKDPAWWIRLMAMIDRHSIRRDLSWDGIL